MVSETVKTVSSGQFCSRTPLKQGVNEMLPAWVNYTLGAATRTGAIA